MIALVDRMRLIRRNLNWRFGFYTELTDARVTAFNVAVHRMMRQSAPQLVAPFHDIVPAEVVGRMSRDEKWGGGFTGFKVAFGVDAMSSTLLPRTVQGEGLAGQLLAAVFPVKEMAGGRVALMPDGSLRYPHFYHVDVPDIRSRQKVIDFTCDELMTMFTRAYAALGRFVRDGEAAVAANLPAGLPCCYIHKNMKLEGGE